MSFHIHNTLTRRKEEFKPLDPANIRLYFCGPTVYNYAHIGNARGPVVYGLLTRVLRHQYGDGHVTYVSNITDIDDKIMEAARQTGEEMQTLTEKFARIYNEDMAALGVCPPDVQPRATQYIPQMIGMISKLIEKGHAYAAEDHVLFDVPSMPDYGRLSGKKRDDLVAGARVEVAPYKKDPADFILWKPSTPDQPGWDSPWGRGRPGWHLECSAMNESINGNSFDIHAGGEDLIFPHHENEIAQSVCAHDGAPYANYWMHHGHLMVEGRKMSKSIGNFLTVHDLIKQYPPEALRYVLLSAHYRQPFDFTHEAVSQAKSTLDRWYGILRDHAQVKAADTPPPADFITALQDDLNTPQALSELSAAARRLATAPDKEKAKGEFLAAGALIGLGLQAPEAWFKAGAEEDAATIDTKIAELKAARDMKDYAKADAIRGSLKQDYGVSISITPSGITWRKEQ
jgi:cysteinyl-tRNA synthetase